MSLQAFASKESKLTMPGFSAELSLRGIAQPYKAHSHERGQADGAGAVIPQTCQYVWTPWGYEWRCYIRTHV